jgi:hypothetical protein
MGKCDVSIKISLFCGYQGVLDGVSGVLSGKLWNTRCGVCVCVCVMCVVVCGVRLVVLVGIIIR